MPAASGTGSLFGLTVTVGSLMTLATMAGMVVYVFHSADDAQAATFQALEGPDELYLRVLEGGPVALATLELRITASAAGETVDLSAYAPELGTHWGPGESVCVVGAPSSCAHPGPKDLLDGIELVEAGHVLFRWAPAAPEPPVPRPPVPHQPPIDGTADLAVWLLDTRDSYDEGRPVRWTARLANNGTGATEGAFEVRFYLDGDLLSQREISPVDVGRSLQVMSAAWQATPGEHELVVVVDEAGTIEDADRADNEVRLRFIVDG